MAYFRGWNLGELEDIRPCDGCGRDYAFVIGCDTGKCVRCETGAPLPAMLKPKRVVRRSRKRVRRKK